MNKRTLRNLQEIDFCIQELTLYLDTHPHDVEASHYLLSLLKKRHAIKEAFIKDNGPLTIYDCFDDECWYHNPWPWDKED